jgi:poly-D-alanine transfer protein DltD
MLKHVWSYLNKRKKYWLLPILAAFIVFGLFLLVSPSNPYAPFIYTFF